MEGIIVKLEERFKSHVFDTNVWGWPSGFSSLFLYSYSSGNTHADTYIDMTSTVHKPHINNFNHSNPNHRERCMPFLHFICTCRYVCRKKLCAPFLGISVYARIKSCYAKVIHPFSNIDFWIYWRYRVFSVQLYWYCWTNVWVISVKVLPGHMSELKRS